MPLLATTRPSPSADYQPYGAAKELFACQSPEVLCSGPAGTGKSLACLYKLHFLASRVDGFRGLIVRKTRESLTESALVTFENNVLPARHPALAGPQRRMRQAYNYPNGSVIIVGGLDKPGKIMSTEYDAVFCQEAIELSEDAWESLTTRLRNGKARYQQLLADTNPDKPTHWLKRRCDAGRTKMLESRHEDNPRLWDRQAKAWTEEGQKYVFGVLDNLTGPRKQRLRFGRWVQAEGVVYEGWDAAIHLIDRFPIPWEWKRYISVDFGFTHPFVAQFWTEDNDGRLYLYREIYRTKRLVEDHAKDMLDIMARDTSAPDGVKLRPQFIVCDHDAEDRATLAKHLGMQTVPAKKEVSAGIQAVASRLRVQGDGKPRLFMMRDSVHHRDPLLIEAKKPDSTASEWDGYVWNTDGGRRKGEEPVKDGDHGMDSCRYMVNYLDNRKKFLMLV